jgi:hypothetical protein
MADDMKLFPKGAIAMGNGDLIDVINVKIDQSNGAKLQHTIRQKGAGISLGVEETTVSFDAISSEDGAERDYLKLLKKGTIKQLRIKVPGETMTVNGMVSKRSLEIPLDDAVKYTIEFIGRTEDN